MVLEHLRQRQDGDTVVYGGDDEDSDTELEDRHRRLEQIADILSGNITWEFMLIIILSS